MLSRGLFLSLLSILSIPRQLGRIRMASFHLVIVDHFYTRAYMYFLENSVSEHFRSFWEWKVLGISLFMMFLLNRLAKLPSEETGLLEMEV